MAERRQLIPCPIPCERGRHYPGHPHLEAAPITEETPAQNKPTGNVSVVGAATPEELARNLQQAITGGKKKQPQSLTQDQVEEIERQARIVAMRPMAREIATGPYDAMALMLVDRRWTDKLTEQKISALEQATLNAMLAWGIEFSGKWSSITALVILHGKTFGTLYYEISSEDEKKRSSGVTPKQPTPISGAPNPAPSPEQPQ